jgi:peptide-methionine (S)-S-oxide reductase
MKSSNRFAVFAASALCLGLIAWEAASLAQNANPPKTAAPSAPAAVNAPDPASGASAAQPETPIVTEKATFAAGCFWGVEEKFRTTEGVLETRVGYIGGSYNNPTYKMVCTGRTGHAEAVEVTYDPSKTSYDKLLKIFWENHNPTTMNRQGPDIGTQYRSAIFYHSPAQKETAEKSKQALAESKTWGEKPIVTQVVQASEFWPAEDYHQKYLFKRGQADCH